MARVINRGDIWIVNLEPAFGREIHKKRPALIVSTNRCNQTTPHVIVVPSSSIVPNELTEEIVPLGKVKGLERESVLLPLLIRSIDQDRLIKKVGIISKNGMQKTEEALKLILELGKP